MRPKPQRPNKNYESGSLCSGGSGDPLGLDPVLPTLDRRRLLHPRPGLLLPTLDGAIPKALQPPRRILRSPRKLRTVPIDVHTPKGRDVTFLPFEIVDKGPGHVPVDPHPVLHGLGEFS